MGGPGARVVRGLGGDDGAPARLPAVAAARRRARRGRVAASFTILDSQGVGYVYQLAVERSHRGRGLAQALLADAFRRAAEHGASHSELSTDSRTGALDLYLKVGMVVTQTWTHLVTDLPRRVDGRSGAEAAHERDVLVTGVSAPVPVHGGPCVVLRAARPGW